MKLFFTTCSCFIFYFNHLSAQSATLDGDSIKTMVTEMHFTFVPSNMFSQSSKSEQITDDYSITVAKNYINSDMPFNGDALTASMDASQNGLTFVSKKSTYTLKDNSKDWEIAIRPRDVPNVRELDFTIYGDGSAKLFVFSNTLQTISYDGHIKNKTEQ